MFFYTNLVAYKYLHLLFIIIIITIMFDKGVLWAVVLQLWALFMGVFERSKLTCN